jgi:riboflavin-specific deaminase-like protein
MSGDAREELYESLLGADREHVTIGHLGQSLDGFIATNSGDSRYVNGRGNLLHLHRMRALCDVVIVGAGTVAADDPQLTTRLVPGRNPVRVVLDPERRLGGDYRVFTDRAARTVLACRATHADRPLAGAEVLGVPDAAEGLDLAALLDALHEHGWTRVFVEGGGRTVSAFLAADLLDRLQLTVAPLIIGQGRPGIRLPAPERLGDCRRPSHRAYRMGEDILYDCDLAAGVRPVAPEEPAGTVIASEPPVIRVL